MSETHGPHGAFDYTHTDYECGWDRVDSDDIDSDICGDCGAVKLSDICEDCGAS
jgi:hypothetical protein